MLYTVDGQWTEAFTIKDAKRRTEIEVYNAKANPTTPLVIADIAQQDPMESRRAWEAVAMAIQKGDMDAVAVEKGKIETEQRNMRKQEQSESKVWVRRYFSCSEDDQVFDDLGGKLGKMQSRERRAGFGDGTQQKQKSYKVHEHNLQLNKDYLTNARSKSCLI